jgi:hypothetical protein
MPVLRSRDGQAVGTEADAKGPDTGADASVGPEKEARGPATRGTAEVRARVRPGTVPDRPSSGEGRQSPESAEPVFPLQANNRAGVASDPGESVAFTPAVKSRGERPTKYANGAERLRRLGSGDGDQA